MRAARAAGLLRDGVPALELPGVTDALLARDDLVASARWRDTATTRELAAAERQLPGLVASGQGCSTPARSTRDSSNAC